MKKPKMSKQQAFFIFATVADIGSLFMTIFYIAYVSLMMALDVGELWLNLTMVVITVLYSWFVLFKIIYLNRVLQKAGRVKRVVKMSQKYTRFFLRIINAAFVVLALIGTQFWESVNFSHIIAIVGIVVMSISLFLSIIWDIFTFMIRHSIKQVVATRAGSRVQVADPQIVETTGEEVKNDG